MADTLAAAAVVGSAEEAQGMRGDVKLMYDSQQHYEQLAAGFNMLLEWRDGVPRGAYKGVVRPLRCPILLLTLWNILLFLPFLSAVLVFQAWMVNAY